MYIWIHLVIFLVTLGLILMMMSPIQVILVGLVLIRSDTASCGSAPKVNSDNGWLTGWAIVLSGSEDTSWDGCISLSGETQDGKIRTLSFIVLLREHSWVMLGTPVFWVASTFFHQPLKVVEVVAKLCNVLQISALRQIFLLPQVIIFVLLIHQLNLSHMYKIHHV